MSLVISGLLRGEFLKLPLVGKAAAVGVTSLFMAAGLHLLGFPYKQHAITATFLLAGAAGTIITVIGMIVYSILAIGFQKGNDRARNW